MNSDFTKSRGSSASPFFLIESLCLCLCLCLLDVWMVVVAPKTETCSAKSEFSEISEVKRAGGGWLLNDFRKLRNFGSVEGRRA